MPISHYRSPWPVHLSVSIRLLPEYQLINESARIPESRERGLLVITRRTRSNYFLRMRVLWNRASFDEITIYQLGRRLETAEKRALLLPNFCFNARKTREIGTIHRIVVA